MEVKFLQFIRDAPKKPLKTVKMIYDERFVDYLSKIMLVHFMTREDRLKVRPWLFRMAILLWDRRFIYSTLWKVFKSSKFWKLYILHTPFSLQKRTRFRLKRTKKQYPSGSYTQDISVICLGCGVNWSLNGRPPTLPPTTPSLRRLFS